jgi:hypothetical protein
MRPAPLALFFALLSFLPAAQKSWEDWYPLRIGHTWTYQNENLDGSDGGIAHPAVTRYRTEETILGSAAIPEGTLVWSHIRALDPPPATHPEWKEQNIAYLVQGRCLYTMNDQGWQPQDHQLTAEFRRSLDAGEVSPDYCFPLTVGETWGAAHWADWRKPSEAKDWKVCAIKVRNPRSPDKRVTFHIKSISSYLGSGMTEEVWFQRGVGVVREQDIHHGTYEENRMWLIRFRPGSATQ